MQGTTSQEAVLEFLIERGGRVKNVDLIERFKPFLAGDPARRAEARERFKDLVDEVGFVKMDNEVRYVCLKKKYMATLLARSKSCLANGTLEEEKTDIQAATVSTDLYEMRPTSTNLTTEISKLESPVPETWSTSSPLTEELTEFHSPPLDNTASENDFQLPQLMNRRSIQHSGRYKDSGKNESDSASLLSSTDEESGFVSLDPLEHEWMMCASNGQWEDLNRLLCCEPTLVLKRDFVTGKQELIALLVNFAKQHDVLLNINARSSAGYTPLHLAVMHNHTEVIKLLVGAYDADVDIRDYSGKKAWQYLRDNVPEDIRDIAGAARNADPHAPGNGAGRWRFSRVLSSNLMPYKLMHVPEEDTYDGEMSVKSRMSYRKSTSVGSTRIRPRLNRIRFKTQIVHSISFRESEDEDRSVRSPTKSRPKSTLFG
uniref:Sosondowah ankyrin repeat domain family Ca n=1 Tax=Erpetoichthys calabaricus TaxID=27687 RepID=A0A8C4SLB8_ERPCA